MTFFKKFHIHPEQWPDTLDVQDIMSNLKNVLNTRRGYGSILDDFGITDMSELCCRELIALAVLKEVEENIRKYEPRVELQKITMLDDKSLTRLSFRIDCKMRKTSRALRLVFDSVYKSFDIDDAR